MSGSHICIPRNEIVISKTKLQCSVSQFLHSYICERFIYFQDQSTYFAAWKYVDQSWEYINRSQTHECGNWDWGRAIPRKGIHKWNFPCSVGWVGQEIYFLSLRRISGGEGRLLHRGKAEGRVTENNCENGLSDLWVWYERGGWSGGGGVWCWGLTAGAHNTINISPKLRGVRGVFGVGREGVWPCFPAHSAV